MSSTSGSFEYSSYFHLFSLLTRVFCPHLKWWMSSCVISGCFHCMTHFREKKNPINRIPNIRIYKKAFQLILVWRKPSDHSQSIKLMSKNTKEVSFSMNKAAQNEQLMLQAVKQNCCCHLLGLSVWYLSV